MLEHLVPSDEKCAEFYFFYSPFVCEKLLIKICINIKNNKYIFLKGKIYLINSNETEDILIIKKKLIKTATKFKVIRKNIE